MEELNQKKERRNLLEYALIFTLVFSGQILDLSDAFVDAPLDIFYSQQAICRKFMLLGFALWVFKATKYDQLKLKTLSFMLCIWVAVTTMYNFIDPQVNHMTIATILYAVYLWWLLRISLIRKPEKDINGRIKQYEELGIAYNILMPVNTFRGLLQILFLPHKCPLYETRVLIADRKVTGIKNKEFQQFTYSRDYIKELIQNGGKIRECKNYRKNKVDRLIGKKMIIGLRDCKRLEQ